MSKHAKRRRWERAGGSDIGNSIAVPGRVIREILGLGTRKRRAGAVAKSRKVSNQIRRGPARQSREPDRAKYHATATGVYVVERNVVVTVLPFGVEELAGLLWWLMTT